MKKQFRIFRLLLGVALIAELVCFVGCSNTDNEQATVDWVKKAKKPIKCIFLGGNDLGNKYTLLDADGNLFATGFVWMKFPDTIKVKSN
ncbi:MAG: hypothetical protein WC879_03480 [Melioribacteraceae bacterium]